MYLTFETASMIDHSQVELKALAVHKVGNKLREEGIAEAQALTPLTDGVFKNILAHYFFSSFKSESQYRFTHEANVELNELYTYSKKIFDQPDSLLTESVNILKHLYEQSNHPKVKSGELYVAYLADCVLEDELADAIGIFKSENRHTFLKFAGAQGIDLQYEQGINIKKLDKGCLIFNTDREDGFRVVTVDLISSIDAQYWKDDFLHLQRVQDNDFHTHNYLQLCKGFAEELQEQGVDKTEQVNFINKSLEYFNENEKFDVEDFAEEVLSDDTKVKEFKEFKKNYDEELGVDSAKDFKISKTAVKKMKRKFKSLIKLDTQIEIKLNPKDPEANNQYVEKGYDEKKGMYFYKVYFNQEA